METKLVNMVSFHYTGAEISAHSYFINIDPFNATVA